MAKKKDQNEDPEEEKKKQFDDDEDFGLPDIDYDELEEEADEELTEEMVSEVETSGTEAEEPAKDVVEVELDEDWEKELEEELEDDLKSGKFDEDTEAFYEEETFDEFESEIEQESVGSSVFGIDDSADAPVPEAAGKEAVTKDDFYMGAEDSEPAPKAKSTPEPQYSQYLDENQDGSKKKFARTVVLGTILFMVVGAIFMFLYTQTGGTKETKKVAKVEQKPEVVVPVDTIPEKKPEPKPEKVVKKPKANTVPAGQISTLEQRTGKSYVVIGSFFDGDMAQDYAAKLSGEGKSPFVIPPFKDHRFYRVAIAEFDNFNDANASVEAYKAEYGAEVWPLRY